MRRALILIAAVTAALSVAGSAFAVSITNYTPTSDWIPEVSNSCVGTSIIINGSGFVNDGGPVTVAFGGTAAVDVTIGSDTQIYARIPGNAPATGQVTVTTAKGTATSSGTYTLDPCAASGGPALISPTFGKTTSSTTTKSTPKCKKGQTSSKAHPCHK